MNYGKLLNSTCVMQQRVQAQNKAKKHFYRLSPKKVSGGEHYASRPFKKDSEILFSDDTSITLWILNLLKYMNWNIDKLSDKVGFIKENKMFY